MSTHQFSRRAMLRGLGVTMALPWLESFRVWGDEPAGNQRSGAPLASGGEIRSGTSIDQVLAQKYGESTKVSSLVLGCEKSNPSVHKNYSMLYSSHISWSSPTTPTPLEIYPAQAFDRLFKDDVSRGDKSVLDAVQSDAKDLRRHICT